MSNTSESAMRRRSTLTEQTTPKLRPKAKTSRFAARARFYMKFVSRLRLHHTIFAALLIVWSLGSSTLQAQSASSSPFVAKYCLDCHDHQTKSGGLNFEDLSGKADSIESLARWVQMHDRVAVREMPPKDEAQPTDDERKSFLAELARQLTAEDAKRKGTVLRRLNRSEYENTLRDLLDVRVEVKELLPEDGRSHGFDNIGEALGISSVQMKRYLEAARIAIDQACPGSPRPKAERKTYSLADGGPQGKPGAVGKDWLALDDGTVVIFNDGMLESSKPVLRSFTASQTGWYRIRFNAAAYQSDQPIYFAVYIGAKRDQIVHSFHEASVGQPKPIDITAWLSNGDTLQLIPTGPDRFPYNVHGRVAKLGGIEKFDGRGLAIHPIDIEGPIVETWPSRGQTLLFGRLDASNDAPKNKAKPNAKGQSLPYRFRSSQPAIDSRRLLRSFAEAAFRRGRLSDNRLEPYFALFDAEFKKSADFDNAMRTAALAVLCAPEFLYLEETPGRLTSYPLASRLAYFLTRSSPDEPLLIAADKSTLSDSASLRRETERLLQSDSIERFIADFTDAWLNLREIDATTPDGRIYPEFDPHLKHSMVAETRAFFGELLRSNLPISNIVRSDFAMLDERMARHYGIAGVKGTHLRKVSLPSDVQRGGIMTQASILKVSANGTSTSPVLRGIWVQERILGFHPPPPPPGVPGLEPDIRGAKTIREQLDKHRTLENCRNCHANIDPPGFALESFDVIGGLRSKYRVGIGEAKALAPWDRQKHFQDGPPVDPSGQLADGRSFRDFRELQTLLLTQRESVVKCLVEKLCMFATGRAMGFSDRPEIDRLVAASMQNGEGVRDLIHLIVQSDIFRNK